MLKLRLLNGPREGQQFRVSDTKPVSIGRNTGRLRLHDSRVSKRHAEVCYEGGVWVIRDVGSSNGTYVNHQRAVGEVGLEPGDLLQIGRVLLKVLRADEVGMDAVPGAGPDKAAGAGVGHGAGADESGAATLADDRADAASRAGIDDADPTQLPVVGEAPAGNDERRAGADGLRAAEDAGLISLTDDGAERGAAGQAERPGPASLNAISDADEGAGDDGSHRDDDRIETGQDRGDASDGTPEVVGLSLGQRPPRQPTDPDPCQSALPGEAIEPVGSDAAGGENETGEKRTGPREGASAESSGFDIDAAFDALAEGLEDENESASPPEAQPGAADGLADSQLDVGFIRDALTKLRDKAQGSETDGAGSSGSDEQTQDRG